MRASKCPSCSRLVLLEELTCRACKVDLGFYPLSRLALLADPAGIEYDGETWLPCSNRHWGCNWLVADGHGTSRCFSCRLTRESPEAGDTLAWEKLTEVGVDKRRLLLQLTELGMPIRPWFDHDGGLGFDLLSSRSKNTPVLIGHANGIITIDLAETLDDYRETLRVRLGEPYRTMLGHFRHEVGHYYQWVLVESGPSQELLDECRELFGDERASYTEAINRHYREGAPDGWEANYISEYATMHPWEDFAECFAHYLHITGTLAVAASGGMVLEGDRVEAVEIGTVTPRTSYRGATIEEIFRDWYWLALFFNRINRSMGQDDLYPFDLVEPVRAKLGFVHKVIEQAAARTEAQAGGSGVKVV